MRQNARGIFILLALMALAACSRDVVPAPTPVLLVDAPTLDSVPQVVNVTPSPSPYPWTDENAVMSGLCFESVDDAAGQTFIIRTPEALNQLFDLADNSDLCRQPVTRHEFDFGEDRILAGIWSRGVGCGAHHEVDNVRRDDTARTLFIFLTLVQEGDCTYELVRPFWIGISGLSDYEIQFVVE